jgi:hypothetical protein
MVQRTGGKSLNLTRCLGPPQGMIRTVHKQKANYEADNTLPHISHLSGS